MRVALHTHGCRLNQFEGDALSASLSTAGHQIVRRPAEADVFVLNSCTITHQADADARKVIRRVRRENPGIRVVVTGCWANAAPEQAASLEGVELVLGNDEKTEVVQRLEGEPADTPGAPLVRVGALTKRMRFAPLAPAERPGRTRPLLKVQDGCNYRCSFCIVPYVRGNSRSLPPEHVLTQLDDLVKAGAPEVVVTGIHLGTYGRDLVPRASLTDLVRRMLPRMGSARLRLSSVDPHEVDQGLVATMAEHPERICRHLHLPVQSCDAEVLRRMRRAHGPEQFRDSVLRLTEAVPGIAIGTDVIVGFPGESDRAFANTVELLRSLPLAYFHVFSYSTRSGTPAAAMGEQVPELVKARRSEVLRRLSAEKRRTFRLRFGGQEVPAVVYRRGHRKSGRVAGLTDNYLEIELDGAEQWRGRWVVARLHADGKFATVVS